MKRSGLGWSKWAATAAAMATLAGMGIATVGCAIHTQAPIREIAYDFSDRDFYDRAYAPSPKYLETEPVCTTPLRTPARPDRMPRLRPIEVEGTGPANTRPTVVLRPGAEAPSPAAPAKPAAKPKPVTPVKPKPAK